MPMLTLLQYNLPLLAVALLIGVATGRWIVRSRASNDTKGNDR